MGTRSTPASTPAQSPENAPILTEEQLEAMYVEWVDGDAYGYECDHYGSQRAAFYAGVAAVALGGGPLACE